MRGARPVWVGRGTLGVAFAGCGREGAGCLSVGRARRIFWGVRAVLGYLQRADAWRSPRLDGACIPLRCGERPVCGVMLVSLRHFAFHFFRDCAAGGAQRACGRGTARTPCPIAGLPFACLPSASPLRRTGFTSPRFRPATACALPVPRKHPAVGSGPSPERKNANKPRPALCFWRKIHIFAQKPNRNSLWHNPDIANKDI